MKQRLLYALLLLFGALGVAQINAQTIQVTSNGTKPVKVTLDKAADDPATAVKEVVYSSDKKTITIDAGYTTLVEIKVTASDETKITVDGNMTALSITGAASLKTLTFGKDNLVEKLTLEAPNMESLTCSGLGMAELDIQKCHGLKTLTASDNKLESAKVTLPDPTEKVLTSVDLSKNKIAAFSSYVNLAAVTSLNLEDNELTKEFDVSDLTLLKTLKLSGNKILIGIKGTQPTGCTVTYGTQRIDMSAQSVAANKGFRVTQLLEKAGIVDNKKDTYRWSATWQVKDNDKVYVEDNGKTAQLQSASDAYKDEYRFYDKDTKIFLAGEHKYQCTVTLSNLQNAKILKYQLYDLKVTPAEFTLNWALPTNAGKMSVQQNDGTAEVADASTPNQTLTVTQGSTLLIKVTPDADKGYTNAVYEIAGLRPADGMAQAPYKGTSLTCVVEGKYISVQKSEEPKVVATVLGAEHKVVFENLVQEGGTFSVQKISGGETVALTSGDVINTGDKLVVTLKPATGYDYYLKINQKDMTDKVVKATKVYTEEITEHAGSDGFPNGYSGETPIAIAVTFRNATIKANALVDGELIDDGKPAYLVDQKITLTTNTSSSTAFVLDKDNQALSILPNTSYQARFTLTDVSSKTYRLKDITINGGELVSKTEELTADGMQYTINFKTLASAVTLSITTKTVTKVKITVTDGANQKQVYDGNAKPILFTTSPANLNEFVEVTYKNSSDVVLGTAPADAGIYTATLTFKETDNYIPHQTLVTP